MPPHHNDLASLLAISLWLLAPHCKLSAGCFAMVTLGLPKAASTFPLQPDWIKLANSILNSLRSLRPCLWPSGTGHSWKDIWLLNLCKNWANHFNPICYSNLLSTENRILERESHIEESDNENHNAMCNFLLRKMLYNLTENVACFSMCLCKQGPNTPFHYSDFIVQPR